MFSNTQRGANMTHTILRLPAVKEKTGHSRSTIYDQVKHGSFPRPVKIGKRAVGWIDAEIEAWLKTRMAARDGGAR